MKSILFQVMETPAEDLGGSTAKTVLLAIAHHCRGGKAQAWPSVARLASLTGLSGRTILTHIKALVARGLLVVSVGVGRSTNLYSLTAKLQKLVQGEKAEEAPATTAEPAPKDPGHQEPTTWACKEMARRKTEARNRERNRQNGGTSPTQHKYAAQVQAEHLARLESHQKAAAIPATAQALFARLRGKGGAQCA